MTNNLGRNEVTAGQNQKEVTINESDGILDAKLTEPITKDFTSGDITLLSSEWQQSAAVLTTNLTVDRLLNTPQQKGYLLVDNSAGTATCSITRGSGSVGVFAGQTVLVYQDGTANGIRKVAGSDTPITGFKDPVLVATTADITLSGEQTIDGVLTSTSRVLVKSQLTASENGIYVSAAGAWARASDFDANTDVTGGLVIPVSEGTTQGNTLWQLTTDDPITVGSTSLTFAQVGAGGGSFVGLTDTPGAYSGAAFQVPRVNGAEDALEFVDPVIAASPGGGMFEFVQTIEGSSVASIDIPLPDNEVIALMYEIQAATDNVELHLQVTDDNFATVETGTVYKWQNTRTTVAGTVVQEESTTSAVSEIELALAIGNASDEVYSGIMNIFDPRDTTKQMRLEYRGVSVSTDNNMSRQDGSGTYLGATAVDGVRLAFSAGNIASVKVHVYKLVLSPPNVKGDGQWEFVETVTAAAAAQLDAPIGDAAQYKMVYRFNPATDNVTLNAQVTTDDFSTVESGASDYSWGQLGKRSGSATEEQANDAADTLLRLSNDLAVGGNATEYVAGELIVLNPNDANVRTGFKAETNHVLDTPESYLIDASGTFNATTVVNGVRFAFSSGNIDDGVVHIYKLVTTKPEDKPVTVRPQQTGTTYTHVLEDAGTLTQFNNAAAITVTVPPNADVPYPTGTRIHGAQWGAGAVQLSPGTGVTIRSRGSLLFSAGQYAGWTLIKVATDEWLLIGDVA